MTMTTEGDARTTARHQVSTEPDPVAVVTEANRRAASTLRSTDADPLDAVAWASAHLAALERTLVPLARRLGHESRAETAEIRRLGRRLHLELRRLEQRSSGDALIARSDPRALRARVVDRLEEFTTAETAMLTRLFAELGSDVTAVAVAAYSRSLGVAPTRPHPHTPHRGLLGAVAFRVEALRDRVLNTMDGRHVPVPRPRRTVREPGRWGQYLLGESGSGGR